MKIETPNLNEMGIVNPDQIIGYETIHVSEDTDVLRINYKRPKGSFLPKRRRYEFKRHGKPLPDADLRGKDSIRYDISPILGRAIAELDKLLANKKQKTASAKHIKQELAELNTEVNERIAQLTRMVEALD